MIVLTFSGLAGDSANAENTSRTDPGTRLPPNAPAGEKNVKKKKKPVTTERPGVVRFRPSSAIVRCGQFCVFDLCV